MPDLFYQEATMRYASDYSIKVSFPDVEEFFCGVFFGYLPSPPHLARLPAICVVCTFQNRYLGTCRSREPVWYRVSEFSVPSIQEAPSPRTILPMHDPPAWSPQHAQLLHSHFAFPAHETTSANDICLQFPHEMLRDESESTMQLVHLSPLLSLSRNLP